MATTKTWAGGSYNLPLNREPKSSSWGTEVSNFLIAVADNAIPKTGGLNTLSAELSFGATYGILLPYVKSAAANIAAAGVLRLANLETISWRNAANGADVALSVNASDRLTIGGAVIPTVSSTDTITNKTFTSPTINTPTISGGNIDNAVIGGTTPAAGTFTSLAATSATVGGAAVTTASNTQTVTNKTLTAPVISDYVKLTEVATPSTPASGFGALYAQSNKVFFKNDLGTVKELGAGGSGEINLVASPSDSVGWSVNNAAGSNPMAVATTTTTGDLPLAGVADNAIQITSRTVAGTEAGEHVNYSLSMSEALKNRKLKVEFWMRPGTNFISNEWTVSVYTAGGTRVPLSTDSSSVTYLPNATGKFTTYFDADSTSSYTLRFARPTNAGGNAAVLNIANVVVGPGIQPQGAVVGEWQSYTPTVANTGSKNFSGSGNTYGKWRRVGDSMEIWAAGNSDGNASGSAATTAVTMSLPTGYTIDQTKLANTSSYATDDNIQGHGRWYSVATASQWDQPCDILPSSSTTVQFADRGGIASPFTYNIGSLNVARAVEFNCHFFVPIAEWAGSGTVNLAQNDVEYASNSKTDSTATDTSSFAYGPSGNFVPNGGTGTTYTRRVRFTTPIQPTDFIVVEVNDGDGWTPANGRLQAYIRQSTLDYGITWDILGSSAPCDVDVSFGNGGYASTSTYGAAGAAWSSISGFKWRVKKIAGANAGGFANATATQVGLVKGGTVPGNTSGSVSAGYIGERLTGTIANSGASYTNGVLKNVASISLTAGIWLVYMAPIITVGTTLGSGALFECSISSVNNAHESSIRCPAAVGADNYLWSHFRYVAVSSTTTYYLNITPSFSSGSCSNHANTTMYAVRVG